MPGGIRRSSRATKSRYRTTGIEDEAEEETPRGESSSRTRSRTRQQFSSAWGGQDEEEDEDHQAGGGEDEEEDEDHQAAGDMDCWEAIVDYWKSPAGYDRHEKYSTVSSKKAGPSHHQGNRPLGSFIDVYNMAHPGKNVNEFEGYALAHKGRATDPENVYSSEDGPSAYSNANSYDKMVTYAEACRQVHGPSFDPAVQPLDKRVLASCGGKAHGQYLLAHSAIDPATVPTVRQLRAEERLNPSGVTIRPRQPSQASSLAAFQSEMEQMRAALQASQESYRREAEAREEAHRRERAAQEEAYRRHFEAYHEHQQRQMQELCKAIPGGVSLSPSFFAPPPPPPFVFGPVETPPQSAASNPTPPLGCSPTGPAPPPPQDNDWSSWSTGAAPEPQQDGWDRATSEPQQQRYGGWTYAWEDMGGGGSGWGGAGTS